MTVPSEKEAVLGPHNVRDLFRYEDSGHLYWTEHGASACKIRYDRRNVPAGGIANDGYIAVNFRRYRYMAHRVVWLWHHLRWPRPGLVVDHINGLRQDNRIANLREVTVQTNTNNTWKRNAKKIYQHGAGYRLQVHFNNLADAQRALRLIESSRLNGDKKCGQ